MIEKAFSCSSCNYPELCIVCYHILVIQLVFNWTFVNHALHELIMVERVSIRGLQSNLQNNKTYSLQRMPSLCLLRHFVSHQPSILRGRRLPRHSYLCCCCMWGPWPTRVCSDVRKYSYQG